MSAVNAKLLSKMADLAADMGATTVEFSIKKRKKKAKPALPAGPLTVKQAAQALGISERTTRDLIARGELGHHRAGNGRGQIRILPRDLDNYRNRERPKFRHV